MTPAGQRRGHQQKDHQEIEASDQRTSGKVYKVNGNIIPQSDQGELTFDQWKDRWMEAVRRDKTISNATKVVAWSISGFINRNSHVAFPSVQTICDDTGLAKSTVKRALRELEARRHVQKEPRFDAAGDRTSNIIRPQVWTRRPADTVSDFVDDWDPFGDDGGGVASDPTSGHQEPHGGVASDPTGGVASDPLTPEREPLKETPERGRASAPSAPADEVDWDNDGFWSEDEPDPFETEDAPSGNVAPFAGEDGREDRPSFFATSAEDRRATTRRIMAEIYGDKERAHA